MSPASILTTPYDGHYKQPGAKGQVKPKASGYKLDSAFKAIENMVDPIGPACTMGRSVACHSRPNKTLTYSIRISPQRR